jgi:F-type H+-transporting ATPase subunit epsilon
MADALPTQIELSVVTPDRQVVHESVESVSFPGKRGYLGILPGHAPLLTELTIGEIDYTHHGTRHYLAVCWGFAEVLPDRVIVLAETAERAEDIDVARAERAKQRAEDRLKKLTDTEIDSERARIALERAILRLQTAHRMRG